MPQWLKEHGGVQNPGYTESPVPSAPTETPQPAPLPDMPAGFEAGNKFQTPSGVITLVGMRPDGGAELRGANGEVFYTNKNQWEQLRQDLIKEPTATEPEPAPSSAEPPQTGETQTAPAPAPYAFDATAYADILTSPPTWTDPNVVKMGSDNQTLPTPASGPQTEASTTPPKGHEFTDDDETGLL